MPRKTKAQRLAEEQAAADAALLEKLQNRPQPEPAPEPVPEPTIADRFVGITNLIVTVQARLKGARTPLSEATLLKAMEIALQYHAWDYQRQQQEQQRFDPSMFMGAEGETGNEDGFVGPEPHERITGTDDSDNVVIPVNFTPESDTPDAESE